MATAIVWPFPKRFWLREGWSIGRSQHHSILDTRRGRVDLRIGTTGPEQYPASVVLTGYEVDDLKAWVQYDLKGGGLWFKAPVRTGHYVETVEIKFVDISEPIAILGVDYWRVTATFMTRRGTEMDAATWADVKAVGGSKEFADINNLLDHIVNEQYPSVYEE